MDLLLCINIRSEYHIKLNKRNFTDRCYSRKSGDYILKKSYLSQFDKVTIISKGMSGDKKYRVEKGDRIGTEYPMFAKGQIDGYFENQVPEEFWKLFALYFAASAITSIVWAKYWAPNKLDSVMTLNKSVLNMFDGMENPIPRWYRDKEIL